MVIDRNIFPYKEIVEKISNDEIIKMIEVMIDNCDRNGKCYAIGEEEVFLKEHIHSPVFFSKIEEFAQKEINSNREDKSVLKQNPSNQQRLRRRSLIASHFKGDIELHLQKESIYQALLSKIAQFAIKKRDERVFSRLHIGEKIQLDKSFINPILDGKMEFYKDGGWGIADEQGNVIVKNHLIIQPSKTKSLFNKRSCPFRIIQDRDTELYGVLSLDTLKEVIHCMYNAINVVKYQNNNTINYIIEVKRNGKWGCYDEDCSFIIECRYDDINISKGWIECSREGEFLKYDSRNDLYDIEGNLMLGGYNYLEINDGQYFKFYYGKIYEETYTTPSDIIKHRLNCNDATCLVLDTHFRSIIKREGQSFQIPLGKVFNSKQELECFCPHEFLLTGYVDLTDYPSFIYVKRYDVDHFFISDYIEGCIKELRDDFVFEEARYIDDYIEDDEVVIIKISNDGMLSWRTKVNEIGPVYSNGRMYRLGDKVGLFSWNGVSSPLYTAISRDYQDGNLFVAKTLYQKGKPANSNNTYQGLPSILFYQITEREEIIKCVGDRTTFDPLNHKWFPYDFLERSGFSDTGDGYYPNDNGYGWTLEDSWDALTDGMYGDMPSNPMDYDAMMDSLGF